MSCCTAIGGGWQAELLGHAQELVPTVPEAKQVLEIAGNKHPHHKRDLCTRLRSCAINSLLAGKQLQVPW